MKDDSAEILEDLLSRWHGYCRGYRPVVQRGADPMFRDSPRPRGHEATAAILEDETERGQLKAVDFHVSEMPDDPTPYRSAIYILARNCYTGNNVWISPRLRYPVAEREVIVEKARAMLTARLMRAGVM